MRREAVIQEINAELNAIFNDKSLTPVVRGEKGEKIVTKLIRYWAESFPRASVEESFIFPQGPIMPTSNAVEEDPVTEIDCLLITPYKIIVVEIKTVYGELIVEDDYTMSISRKGKPPEVLKKNYLRQNEMHARHLYYHLHKVLPKGDPRYIEQLIVLTGNMSLTDNRSSGNKREHITITNNLIPTLEELVQPRDNLISAKAVNKIIGKIRVLNRERLLNSQTFKGEVVK